MQRMVDGVLVDLTPEEVAAFHAESAAYAWDAEQAWALTELALKDRVVIRCAERGDSVPEAWGDYADTLRGIGRLSSAPDGYARPERPAYP